MSDVRIRTMNLDAVLASTPLNRTASTVRDADGEHWAPEIPSHIAHFKAPPLPERTLEQGHIDMTGFKVGRLTVVRFHGTSGARQRSVWLVRCSCGDYELRRGERLRKMVNPDACCFVCQRTLELRALAAQPSTSKTRERSAELLNSLAAKDHSNRIFRVVGGGE